MVVRTISKGRETTGLRLLAEDAARHFSPQVTAIQLRLGDVQIECELPADFRTGRPEIFELARRWVQRSWEWDETGRQRRRKRSLR